MQVKKFEAPTIQEALENVKRELGPEAIILQTKKNKRGFGLLSKASVEVTAAISERSLTKKQKVESRIQEDDRDAIKRLPAERQANMYDRYIDRNVEKAKEVREKVDVAQKRITATRYIDIEDEGGSNRYASPLQAQSTPDAVYSRRAQAPLLPQAPVVQTQMSQAHLSGNSGLEEEVKLLKQMLQEMKVSQQHSQDLNDAGKNQLPSVSLDIPALQDIFEQLVMNGVERRIALTLVKKAAFELGSERSRIPELVTNRVAHELMETLKVMSPFERVHEEKKSGRRTGPLVVSFIGPTGVGKTTTLAKIASEAQFKRQLKVGLINLDYYKLTAFDQLATYGKILHVPFRSVASVEDVKVALLDFQNLDLVLVDTTGRSHRDPQSLKEIQELLGAVPDLMTLLVLSATTRDSELFDAASRFSTFRPEGLIMSKLDEVVSYGGIYNLTQKVNLPLLYFTTGQRVPDDIETATRERLVALLMGF